ncbi:hypothetical protein L6452_20015 [Arctium lappa]|uniref:Uncharacterized protein n=1 Tax=Arctium lappa TaxID=4217 RepID=A0ACB9BB12_ARCLA|nr:hypothetical protein L6452_20015 [Arctium lappa]
MVRRLRSRRVEETKKGGTTGPNQQDIHLPPVDKDQIAEEDGCHILLEKMDATKSPEKMGQIVGKDATYQMDEIADKDQTHPPSFYLNQKQRDDEYGWHLVDQKQRDDEDVALLVSGEDILLLVLGYIFCATGRILSAFVRQKEFLN